MYDALTEKLAELGCEYACKYSPNLPRNDDWQEKAFAYLCTLERGSQKFTRPMFCGLGWTKKVQMANGRTVMKRVEPTIADFAHSILMDARSGESTHAEFCDDFGYDVDSIRARETWLACVETRNELRRIFDDNELAELTEAASDY